MILRTDFIYFKTTYRLRQAAFVIDSVEFHSIDDEHIYAADVANSTQGRLQRTGDRPRYVRGVNKHVVHVLGTAEVQRQELGHSVVVVHVTHLLQRVQVPGHDRTKLSCSDVDDLHRRLRFTEGRAVFVVVEGAARSRLHRYGLVPQIQQIRGNQQDEHEHCCEDGLHEHERYLFG